MLLLERVLSFTENIHVPILACIRVARLVFKCLSRRETLWQHNQGQEKRTTYYCSACVMINRAQKSVEDKERT